MQKPEWKKMGSIEVCVGTDGVTGVMGGGFVEVRGALGVPLENLFDDVQSAKAQFERKHCQPPKPCHIIREYADGSCVVESTEKDEQGRPLRCVRVWGRRDTPGVWDTCRWMGGWLRKDRAIEKAVRYVETGE